MGMPLGLGGGLHRHQALQDAASVQTLLAVATRAQRLQLQLEVAEFFDAFVHMGNVLVKHGIYCTTTILRTVRSRPLARLDRSPVASQWRMAMP